MFASPRELFQCDSPQCMFNFLKMFYVFVQLVG